MRAAVWRALPRLGQNARLHRGRPHCRGLSAIPRAQPRQPVRFEPLFPPADVVGVTGHGRRDARERLARGQHQNHLRAAGVFRPDFATADTPFEFRAFVFRQCQRHMALEYTTSNSVVTVH
jgi:hypothetical protein